MPFCHHCGREVGSLDARCNYCGAEIRRESSYPYPASPTPWQGSEDEEFLDSFSWAPGCGWYFFSNAMSMFLLFQILINVFSTAFDAYSEGLNENTMSLGEALFLIVGGLGLMAIQVGLLVWAGKVSRRRRWQILKWRDFEQFRQNENAWNTVGIIGWVIVVIVFVGSFFLGLVGAI